MNCSYRTLFAGIFVIAFATLLFEVSLIRVFSFTIWHHFGYVVISTALLGFAASGTYLAVRPSVGATDLRGALAFYSALAALTGVGMLAFVALVPLHPMSILAEGKQALILIGYQIGTTIPFFFSGLVISLALRAAAKRVDRLYFWDLLGAGLGCAAAIVVMNQITPPGAVVLAGAGFAGGAIIFAGSQRGRLASAGLAVILLVGSFQADEIPFTVARTKEYAKHIGAMQMVPRKTVWKALFRTDVVEDLGRGPRPERCIVWGASRLTPKDCERPRYFMSHDATAGTGIFDLEDLGRINYLDYHVLHLPYLVANPDPEVLVIGVGGGRDIITALQYGASHVTGVELDPVAVDLLKNDMNGISNGLFNRPEVDLIAGEGRHFVRATDRKFDLIQTTGVDTLSAEFSGSYVLAESYLYTVEAFHDYFDLLKPKGMMSFVTANMNPNRPRALGKMVSIAQRALRERGFENPLDHMVVIATSTLYAVILIRQEPFEPAEVARLAERAKELQLAPLLLPGRNGHPVFRMLAEATGEERRQALLKLPFYVEAPTDDQPFFMRYYRWNNLFIEDRLAPSHASATGQIVLLLLVASLSLLGALLVLAPLAVFRRRGIAGGPGEPLRILFYFLAVGVGFMFFEISLIQRFVLFLGYPVYSLGVTLASLLIFLGWGSFLSKRWVGHERTALPLGVLALVALYVFYVYLLPGIQDQLLGTPLFVRILVTVAVLAPLGLVLGMFFPLGIRRAESVHPDLIPWAWGINGFASVTGGVLAVILAMSFGFSFVWALSVGVYALGVAALLIGRPSSAVPQPRV